MDYISFKLNKESLNKFIFTLLVISVFLIKSFEFSFLVYLLLFVFYIFENVKLSKTLLEILLPLTAIVIITIPSSLLYKASAFDTLKGFLYLTKPILMIGLGYFLCLKIKNYSFLFYFIIYLSLFFGVIHIAKAVGWFFSNESINQLRGIAGKGSDIELLGLPFFLTRKRIGVHFSKIKTKIYFIILVTSLILYFSRTQLVGIVILLISILGYTKLSRKSIIIISSVILSAILFYVYLNSINLERGASGIDGFLYKLKIAPQEMFSTEIDVNNHAQLWDRWRSYEAKMAFEQLQEAGPLAIIFGKGIGATVDIKIDYLIPSIQDRYIPILHNGYAFIIYKSGILGVISYLLFLGLLYIKTYLKSKDSQLIYIRNLVSGLGMFFTFSTLIVSGIYNVNGILPLILGFVIGLEVIYKRKLYENSNIRN